MGDTANQYLSVAIEEYRARVPNVLIGQISGANRWLEDAELRLNSDDSENRKTSYQLRLEPKGFGQAEAEQNILNYHEKIRHINYQIGLSDLLKQKYLNIIELLEIKTHMNGLKQRLKLVDSEVQFYRSQAASESFQPEKLQSVILQRSYLQKQLKNERLLFSARTKSLEINPDDLLLRQTIPPLQVLDVIKQLVLEENALLDLEKSRLKLKIFQENRTRLRARKGISFSLLQIEHETSVEDNNTSIGFGLRIPLGQGSFNARQQEYSISDMQSEIYDKALAVRSKLEDKKNKIKALSIESKLFNLSLSEIDSRLRSNADSQTAELTLLLKQKQVATIKQQADIHLMLLRNYIEYLHVAGRLIKQPIHNWLKPGFPQL